MIINPLKSWTVSFFRRWLPYMSPLSVLRYRNAVCRVPRNPIQNGVGKFGPEKRLSLRIKRPFERVIVLRENTFDFITFEEVVFEQVYRTIPAHLPVGKRIIDLGANIGLASLYLATCYPSSKIAAVEPLSQNYSLLMENLATLIQNGRCLAMEAAVWGKEGTLVLERPDIPDRYNAYTVRQSTSGSNVLSEIQGLTIARIMERAGFHEVDIVKVDIEGAETELFKGDLNWLNYTRAIAIEFHGNSRQASNFDEIMRQYKFTIQAEDGHTVLALQTT